MKAEAENSYTILRIKRKRNEEPLDVLVVDSSTRKKKTRAGLDIFQFAQTVEHDAWDDEAQRRGLQEQISRLARENAARSKDAVPSPAEPAPQPQLAAEGSQHGAPNTEPQPSLCITQTQTFSENPQVWPPSQVSKEGLQPRLIKEDSNRRYQIVAGELLEEEKRQKPLTRPPQVKSVSDLPPPETARLKLYDAVLAPLSPSVSDQAMDQEMEKFIPMLNDYLKLHDVSLPSSKPGQDRKLSGSMSADDYVWDVFYHRPATLSEWNEAAVSNIATLTGLPPSEANLSDSDWESEAEDEADEDSNAEEYYKNDYPDEESDDDDEFEDANDGSEGSDIFHEGSEHLDLFRDDDDAWR